MSDIAIRVENLSKQYQIGQLHERHDTLRDALVAGLRHFGHNSQAPNANGDDTLWALKDVSFEVKRGEVVGIIGRNGAGKSTLLKILSRITEPSSGRAEIHGRVGSLLEVGTGFHPELTGRENIYLNGAILGMRRHEIERKFDEIVEFAEIEKFLDTPVKRYSSGMYVRLAFAVAAHLEPEILLVDEVLAVGDAEFQTKCLGKMSDVAETGRTVLFVSHNMQAITNLCPRTLWIDRGKVGKEGQSEEIIASYLSSASASATGFWRRPENNTANNELALALLEAELFQAGRSPVSVVSSDRSFELRIKYEVRSRLRNCAIVLRITDMKGVVIFTSWDTDTDSKFLRSREPGKFYSVCSIPAHLIKPGRYAVSIGARINNAKFLDFQEAVFYFDLSIVGYSFNPDREGIVQPILDWTHYTV